MAKIRGDALGKVLCAILGEKPDDVESVTVIAEAGGLAKVEIIRHITDVETAQLVTVMKLFELKLLNETEKRSAIFGADGALQVPTECQEWDRLAKQALEQAKREESNPAGEGIDA